MAHLHSAVERLTRVTGFVAPIAGAELNRAAHGNVCETETCRCGATRSANVNGRHAEQGPWDLPEWVADANPEAIAYQAADARRLLVALAASRAGRDAIERAGYSAILAAPARGADRSTLSVARAAVRELRAEVR